MLEQDKTSRFKKRGKRRNKFYRGKYLIALYDDMDRLIAICDNAYEFKDFLDIPTLNTANSILSKIYLGKVKSVNFRGERLEVYFISLSEKEKEEMKWNLKKDY